MFLFPAITPPAPADVFVSGSIDPGQAFDTFRIPALCCTRRGTLLAFAEGRKSVTDQAANQIVIRRFPRGAKEWTPLQIVRNEGPASLNNPCVLASREGRVWLMYQRYSAGYQGVTAVPGLDPQRSCFSFVTSSDDDGVTWSVPTDITAVVKGAGIRSVASGPGVGVELRAGARKGRLLFPFNEGTGSSYNVFAVFSDDQGKTWRRGPTAFHQDGTQPNENQVAEAEDGVVYLNCRNEAPGKFRLTSRSHDGGEIWDFVSSDPNLVDPTCMGSVTTLRDQPNVLAFSNGESTTSRSNGVLKLSFDGGNNWVFNQVIEKGSFNYSCLCPLNNHLLGILYEFTDLSSTGSLRYLIRYQTLRVDY